MHSRRHILARSSCGVDVEVGTSILTAGVQQFLQSNQRGGLTRLAGRVQEKVATLIDQPQQLRQVEPGQRRHVIMLLLDDRTGRVEKPHCRKTTAMTPPTPAGRPELPGV